MAELNIQGSNQELLGLGKDSKLGTKAPQPAADTKVVTPEEEVAQKAPTKAASQMEQTIRDILGDDLTNLGDGGTKIATGLQLGQSERGADIIRGVMLQEEGLKGLDKQAIIKQKINAATTAIAKQKQEIEFQKRQDEVKEQKTEDNAANVAALLRKAVSTPDPAARRDIAIQALTAADRRVDVTKPIIIEPSGEIAFNEITRMSDGSFQSVALKKANATDLAKTKETKALISNAISLGNADLENAMVKVSNESMFEGAKVADANIAEAGERRKLALSTSGQGRELRDTAEEQKAKSELAANVAAFVDQFKRQPTEDELLSLSGVRKQTATGTPEDFLGTKKQVERAGDIQNTIQTLESVLGNMQEIDPAAFSASGMIAMGVENAKSMVAGLASLANFKDVAEKVNSIEIGDVKNIAEQRVAVNTLGGSIRFIAGAIFDQVGKSLSDTDAVIMDSLANNPTQVFTSKPKAIEALTLLLRLAREIEVGRTKTAVEGIDTGEQLTPLQKEIKRRGLR